MGTPELDSRLIGLQSFLANTKGSEQESSDTYRDAHWLTQLSINKECIGPGKRIITSQPSTRHLLILYWLPFKKTGSFSPKEKTSHIFTQADHGGMVKFESQLDEGYLKIKEHLVHIEKMLE
ncbi:unnamed protein product [Penicillium glandicola]